MTMTWLCSGETLRHQYKMYIFIIENYAEGIDIWTELILNMLNIWIRMPGYLWVKVADYVYYFVCV